MSGNFQFGTRSWHGVMKGLGGGGLAVGGALVLTEAVSTWPWNDPRHQPDGTYFLHYVAISDNVL